MIRKTFDRWLPACIGTGFLLLGMSPVLVAENENSPTSGSSQANKDNSRQQAITLAYKFHLNQFVHFEVKHTATIKTQFGDASQTVENEAVTRKHYRVASVDENGAGLLELTIDRVRMSAQWDDGEPTVFDSRDGEKKCPPQFRHVLATVGNPLAKIRFAPSGRIIQERSGKDAANAKEEPSQVGGPTSDESAGQSFLVIFPETPVRVGDSWFDDIQTEVNVTTRLKKLVTIRRTYRLHAVDGPLATIGLKTSIITPINDPALEAQLIQRTPEGTILFDIEQGQIASRRADIDNAVLNPFGEKSSMRAVSQRVEKRLTAAEVAAGDKPQQPSETRRE